jgi:hypothetical protein
VKSSPVLTAIVKLSESIEFLNPKASLAPPTPPHNNK